MGYTTRYSFYRLQYVTYIIYKATICKQIKKCAKTPHGILAHASLSLLTLKNYLSYKTKLINYCAVNSTT